MWGAVLSGVGVAIPQGPGLCSGLSAGWTGQHRGSGSSQIHSTLRWDEEQAENHLNLDTRVFKKYHPGLAFRSHCPFFLRYFSITTSVK